MKIDDDAIAGVNGDVARLIDRLAIGLPTSPDVVNVSLMRFQRGRRIGSFGSGLSGRMTVEPDLSVSQRQDFHMRGVAGNFPGAAISDKSHCNPANGEDKSAWSKPRTPHN